jgi:uncharacterized zinc-type alcohol dehydrogenase-like protein
MHGRHLRRVNRVERAEEVQLAVVVRRRVAEHRHLNVHGKLSHEFLFTQPALVGRVTRAGARVKKFKEGDLAAVGCMVDSCRTCESCRVGLEQLCEAGPTFTYNSPDKKHGGTTYGGYADSIVLDEAFALRLPKSLDLAASAPLLCAGITTYSPLRRWKIGKGQKVGVVGLGGLGHMGVKLAKAFGARVVLFTTSPGKTQDAIRLGAQEVVLSKNADGDEAAFEQF